jgi:hypothetical protein
MVVDLCNAPAENAGKTLESGPQRTQNGRTNAKKILNRGNKPKDLLKTQDLAVFGAKNEPKTDSVLRAKMCGSK